jgi:hypothetical protein
MNMGAYFHIQPRLESCLRAEGRPTTGRITYAGRPPSASTATGFGQVHAQVRGRRGAGGSAGVTGPGMGMAPRLRGGGDRGGAQGWIRRVPRAPPHLLSQPSPDPTPTPPNPQEQAKLVGEALDLGFQMVY